MQANNRDAASLWDMVQAIRRYDQIQQGIIWNIIDSELVNLSTQIELLLPPEPS